MLIDGARLARVNITRRWSIIKIIMVALSSIKMDELLISWLGSDVIYENVMRGLGNRG
jgi:hypothetical protein